MTDDVGASTTATLVSSGSDPHRFRRRGSASMCFLCRRWCMRHWKLLLLLLCTQVAALVMSAIPNLENLSAMEMGMGMVLHEWLTVPTSLMWCYLAAILMESITITSIWLVMARKNWFLRIVHEQFKGYLATILTCEYTTYTKGLEFSDYDNVTASTNTIIINTITITI